jgi:isovaleryl-CoA dehydrogenase
MVLESAAVVAAVGEVARTRVAADAARVDRDRVFPRAGLDALASVGGLGLCVPGEHGGAGGGLSDLAGACEAVGSACASTGMVYLMHSVTAATLGAGGGASTTEALHGMAEGRVVGTLAFSERSTGAHFYAPEIRAERVNGHVRVSGRKSFVTSGGEADVYVLLVAEDEGTDAYLLQRDAPGARFDGTWTGLGMAGNSSVALELDGAVLSEDDRVGARGAAGDLVFGVVAPFFLIGLASVNVGIAAAAAEAATAHAAARGYAGGGRLAEVEHIQHLVADNDADVRAARLVVQEAARLGEAGDPSALVAIMEAKVVATETAATVTDRALRITGGQGYTPALPIERHLRDARAGAVMAPTNSVLRSWIGKALLGLPVP